MNRKYCIVAASLFLTVSPAMAQQWQYLGTHGSSSLYFMNPKTLSVTPGKTVKCWTKREMDVDTKAKANEKPDEAKGRTSMVAYNEFDCDKRQKRTQAGMNYDNTRHESREVDRSDWQPVQPGTLEGDLLEAVCRASHEKKK
ncbi:MAG: hypothetical protein FPO08_16440 [Geobacter sp.]|nr:MAG: hypothetical protein FPO08_16440 [Geobacter sp.]